MFAGKANKVLLPLAVISVLAMVLFPLPSWLLDIMLAANLAFCVILLLTSLFVSEPDRFTTLPSILLLSTLFRLGLNVSSTRLILSGVDVPAMIISFGQFVVGGSTIVGLVIFSIISIIQFIVIAKGSERVAEVAARFTLDALPGKQMSIDADMRAGLLSLSEAREKRRELHRESKLYGALDGAMKFIKGDAIVGLCIILVNITAGFLIGVVRDGLSLMVALDRYTLLTIGDGLVGQIPAVLVSIAAGIVITRVSETEGGSLSDEIGSQLSGEPVALLISGLVLLVFSLIPGLPFVPLMISSFAALYFWRHNLIKLNLKNDIVEEFPFQPKILPPLAIRLSSRGARQLQAENRITGYYDALRTMVFEEKGVILPDLCFDIDPIEQKITSEVLILGKSYQKVEFLPQAVLPGCIDSWSRCLGSSLKEAIYQNLPSFICDTHTRRLLDLYEQRMPDVIRSIIPEKLSTTAVTIILRSLVEEGFSIREFPMALEVIGELFEKERGEALGKTMNVAKSELLLAVREILMESYLSSLLPEKMIEAYVFGPELENSMLSQIAAGLFLHPDVAETIRQTVYAVLDSNEEKRLPLVLLVPSKIRPTIYHLLNRNFTDLLVLAYEELPDSYAVNLLSLDNPGRMREAA